MVRAATVVALLLSTVAHAAEPDDLSVFTLKQILTAAVSMVFTAIGTFVFTKKSAKSRFRAALVRFCDELETVISRAIEAGPQNAMISAKSIVAARKALQNSLISGRDALNGEIDALARLVGEQTMEVNKSEESDNPQQAWQQIQVLAETWSAKRAAIVEALRLIATNIGVDPAILVDLEDVKRPKSPMPKAPPPAPTSVAQ